ncbi:MAG: ubiquinol-cytochrome c reductase iron-sulfur subunit [Candidatus Microthrix sp.]|nr:ubiquinol-cytochrome c reductase iron-sulfur subunit [Candidatus Microthrix sp.]
MSNEPQPEDGPGGASASGGQPGDPLWRDEFPLTSEGEDYVARRDFTRYLIAASGVFAAGAVGAGTWATMQRANTGEPRAIIKEADIPEDGEYLFKYPGDDDPAILVKLPNGDLRAFTQKCTHLGCVVYYKPEEATLYCPCHHGFFDPDSGAATAGPPDRPLAAIDVEVRGDTVWALGIET